MDYSKLIDDSQFNKYIGKNFGIQWYNGPDGTIVNSDKDGYYISESGERKVLFKFRKGVINNEFQNLAIKSFLQESKKKHSNRGIAGGIQPGETNARSTTKTGQNEGKYIASNISGYYDRALREHRGLFKTQVACRTTAFTLRNKELWASGLPFIQRCSKEYSRLAPKEYSKQKKEWDSIKPQIKIPNTVFTTVTSNYNWRTACHKDSGDFPGGLGNLVVVGNGFSGGYLGFPQFKVLIKIKPGDFLLMDVHQWHCNTPILKKSSDSFRLSFVMYIREDMKECKTVKNIGQTKYLI